MKVKTIEQSLKLSKPLRVAAYARVSRNKESLVHSFNAQVEHYQKFIKANKNYIYKGVYADLGISGTKDNREEFNKLLEECRKGNIDLILTKSISRFARNTATLLKVVRELKNLKVDVFFEEQRLHSISEEGEFILTLLASMAQEEARDMSENVKWTVLKRFKEGKYFSITIYGYRLKDGVLMVEPNEAEVVKQIFSLYLEGFGAQAIATRLNKQGIKSRFNRPFSYATIYGMLHNEVYTGNIILQTTYRENFMTKKTLRNKGQRRMWKVEEAHEPIIDSATFTKVQKELKRREKKATLREEDNPFQKMIVCHYCGRHFCRKLERGKFHYVCNTYDKLGKDGCPNKKLPLWVLEKLTKEVLGIEEFSESFFKERIDHIEAFNDNKLVYYFKNGKIVEKEWKYPSRSESWTPEMKELARQRSLARKEIARCQE